MEKEILSKYPDAKIEQEIGSGGNFIVEVDGEKIFSKKEMEFPRFPNKGEITDIIEKNIKNK